VTARAAIDRALSLLSECLEDEEPWEPERLVERMEAVYHELSASRVSNGPYGSEGKRGWWVRRTGRALSVTRVGAESSRGGGQP